MKTLEGNVIGKGLKVGIVAARFNEFIVNKLIGVLIFLLLHQLFFL